MISAKQNAIINIIVEKVNIFTLVLNDIDLDFTKLSKLFLYSSVDKNHVLNRSEPLAKKKEANNRNGVVGKTGNTAPTAPIIKNKKAEVRYIAFFIVLIYYTEVTPLSNNFSNDKN